MHDSSIRNDLPALALGLLIALAAVKLAIHLGVNLAGGYGYFRDEFYYIACAQRLDIGYVDQPPLSIWILAASLKILGKSLVALRFLPALAGAVTVFVTGLLARQLGGGRFAQALAALCALVSLVALAFSSIYNMNAFDLLIWVLVAYLTARLLNTRRSAYWPWLGLVLGLGLLNKVSVLWLGAGLALGLLLTPNRRWIRSRGPWLAALLALLLFSPYILWNLQHDAAHLEFIENAKTNKYAGLDVARFLGEQPLLQNPPTIVVWLPGLLALLFSRRLRRYRLLAWLYLGPLLILILNQQSKAEYLGAAYGVLFAAGAVTLEAALRRPVGKWLQPLLVVGLVGGLFMSPMVLPVLPVESYIAFAARLGIGPSTSEGKELAELPQGYADRFGWEEKAAAMSRVVETLPAAERSNAVLFGSNYGQAGCLEFFAAEYDLPPAISSHNNYWLWGYAPYDGTGPLILLGSSRERLDEGFEEVEEAGVVTCRFCMPYENDLTIFIARRPKMPVAELWAEIKHYE